MHREVVYHVFPPLYNENSKILILGTIPSPKSRENGFYYSHPQNRFWRVMASVFDTDIPKSIDEKSTLMLRNNIALWDVLESCEISGAEDSSIKSEKPNDLNLIIKNTQVHTIFTTGKKAFALYNKYCLCSTNIQAVRLPSTSPANCAVSLDKLIEEYRIIKEMI